MPRGECCLNGVEPSRNSSFATVDFLTSSHKTNHHSPVIVSIEIGDKQFGFGLIEAYEFLFPKNEARGHFPGPCPWDFSDDALVVAGGTVVAQAGVAEMMHVLDERVYCLSNYSFACFIESFP